MISIRFCIFCATVDDKKHYHSRREHVQWQCQKRAHRAGKKTLIDATWGEKTHLKSTRFYCMKICIVQAYILTLSTERDLHVLEQRTHFLVMYVVTLNL